MAYKHSPLHSAAQEGHDSECAKLLRSGMNPYALNKNKKDALQLAYQNGHYKCLKELFEYGVKLDMKKQHADCFGDVIEHNYFRCLELLLQYGADPTATDINPLYHAVYYLNINCVKLLIDAGALNDNRPIKNDLLHRCIWGYHHHDIKPLVPILKLLLDAGIHINTQNHHNDTSIIIAVYYGKSDIYEFLIENGADPYIKGETGLNAFQWAEKRRLYNHKLLIGNALKKYNTRHTMLLAYEIQPKLPSELLDRNIWRLIRNYIN